MSSSRSEGFDWRKSPAHLLFLTTFLEPRPPDQSPTDTPWEQVLGEPPEQAVEHLLADKALRVCSGTQILRHELPKLSADDLRELLRERGLPVNGNKETLVWRLTQRFEPSLLLVIPNRYLLECSDQGKELADNYLQHGIAAAIKESRPEVSEAAKKVVKWVLFDLLVTGVTYDVLKKMFVNLWPDKPLPLPEVKPVPTAPEDTPEPDETPQPAGAERRKPGQRTTSIHEPEMVRVPAGYFWMGSNESDPDAFSHEKPQHRLHLPEYWIGRCPVTVAQFSAFVKDTGYVTTDEKNTSTYTWLQPHGANSNVRDKAGHPVTRVSWYDALAYCHWLSALTGKPYTLPSEAEWEKAARGGNGRIYPWGNKWDSSRCNAAEGGKGDTPPVGYYSPDGDSPYGCADMAGNVYQWTRSLFGDYPYPDQLLERTERENLSARSVPRVLRGGSFNNDRGKARCAYRLRDLPDFWVDLIGFRVVVSPSGGAAPRPYSGL